MTESMVRDQVVAARCDIQAGFSFDDVRRILQAILPALASGAAMPVKSAIG
jgi:hypothetical protein